MNDLYLFIHCPGGIPKNVIEELESMGHKMKLNSQELSAVQGIEKTNDDLGVYSDLRKQGRAAEYWCSIPS